MLKSHTPDSDQQNNKLISSKSMSLAAAFFSSIGALVGGEKADAAIIDLTFTGRVEQSGSENFETFEEITGRIRINTNASPNPGGTPNHLFHSNALEHFYFSSNIFDSIDLSEVNDIEVKNETSASSDFGDYVAIHANDSATGISMTADVGFTYPNPGGSDAVLSSANLANAILALNNFNNRSFYFTEYGVPVGGPITALSLSVSDLIGDFDRNGIVNGLDLKVWQGEYGQSATLQADADLDGDVDGRDFLAWQRNYGQGGPSDIIFQQTYSIPEPGMKSMLLTAAASLMGFARKLFK